MYMGFVFHILVSVYPCNILISIPISASLFCLTGRSSDILGKMGTTGGRRKMVKRWKRITKSSRLIIYLHSCSYFLLLLIIYWTLVFFFCNYFLLWSSAIRRVYVMVRFDSLWVYDPHDGEVNLWCVWICTVFRWYQVRERLGHFLELALPCWFCVLQTYIHSLWWSFRLFLLSWYKGKKALLSGSRGTIEPLSKFIPFICRIVLFHLCLEIIMLYLFLF